MEKATFHTHNEIFKILGEQNVYNDFHVQYIDKHFPENPISYPFKSDNTALLLLLEGEMKINVNLEVYHITKNFHIIFPSNSYTHILSISQHIKSVMISFSDDFAISNLKNFSEINNIRLLSDNSCLVASLSTDNVKIVTNLAENLHQLNSDRLQVYSMERIHHYFNALSLELLVFHNRANQDLTPKTSRQTILIQNFLEILFANSKKERSVQFYADKLSVTPGYLSKILKKTSGQTASDIIEEAVVIEARNLLQNSDLSIAQIADRLHFSDQSFFGKFFKKKMKISPKEFRNQKAFT